MRRFVILCATVIVAAGSGSTRLAAQTTQTDCWTWRSSGDVSCRSRTSPDPGQAIGDAFRAYAEDRRIREADERARQLAASQTALLESLARERQYAAQAERERAEAQARLFWRRAETVLIQLADSLALDSRATAALNEDAIPLLKDILIANPTASTAEISDNLAPAFTPLARRSALLVAEAQRWIQRNRSTIESLTPTERDRLLIGIVRGRDQSMRERDNSASALVRNADEALAAVSNNRRKCASGDTDCERAVLPSALQRTHDIALARRAREARPLANRRARALDSALAILAPVAALSGETDSAGALRALRSHAQAIANSTPLVLDLRPQAIATDAESRARLANSRCIELAICDSALVYPSALDEYGRRIAARARADTANAMQECRTNPGTCRDNLLPETARSALESTRREAIAYPFRLRMPEDLATAVAGPDTVISFRTEPYRTGWFQTGGRSQLTRRTSVGAEGRSVVTLSLREELLVDYGGKRIRRHVVAKVDSSTGFVFEYHLARTGLQLDRLTAFIVGGDDVPICDSWRGSDQRDRSWTFSKDRLGIADLFLMVSLVNPDNIREAITGYNLQPLPISVSPSSQRVVVLANHSVAATIGRTQAGITAYGYGDNPFAWFADGAVTWPSTWLEDPALVCGQR